MKHKIKTTSTKHTNIHKTLTISNNLNYNGSKNSIYFFSNNYPSICEITTSAERLNNYFFMFDMKLFLFWININSLRKEFWHFGPRYSNDLWVVDLAFWIREIYNQREIHID